MPLRALTLATLVLIGCAPIASNSRADGGAAQCASCHPDHVRDHSGSRHARAAMGELYQRLRDRGDLRTRSFCDSCHRPATGTSEGLSCESCHSAVGNSATLNAQLRWDPSAPLSSARADSASNSAHRTRQHGFLSSSELCGSCHEVRGPGAFHETPFTEWQRSPAAQSGIQCVHCHGSPTPGAPEARPALPAALDPSQPTPARARTDHRFVGPDDEDARAVASLLAQSALVTLSREGEQALVTVSNRGLGHALPTGVRAVRELWIEVSEVSASGATHVRSGALDERGELPPYDAATRMDFHDELSGDDPLTATIVRVRALDPGGSRAARFSIAADAARVVVRLRYRSQSQRLRASLALEGTAPIIDVARVELAWNSAR